MRSTLTLIAVLIYTVGLASSAGANVPRQFSFQGKVTDNNGNAAAGPVDLSIKLYDSPVTNLLLWSESHAGVALDNGVFTILVGSATAGGVPEIAINRPEVWLGISVNGAAELTPRTRIVSAPYALKTVDDLVLGAPNDEGSLTIYSSTTGGPEITLNETSARISTYGSNGNEKIRLYGPSWGELWLHDSIDNDRTVFISAGLNNGGSADFTTADGSNSINLSGSGGTLRTYQTNGNTAVVVGRAGDGAGFLNAHLLNSIWAGVTIDGWDGNSGTIQVNKINGTGFTNTVDIDADAGDGGALVRLGDGTRTTLNLDANGGDGGAGISMYNSAGGYTIELDADESDDGVIRMFDAAGNTAIRLHSDLLAGAGEISLFGVNGTTETVEIAGAEGANNGGQITVRNSSGSSRIVLDAEFGDGGPGRITTDVLEIRGGSDLSEQFDVVEAGGDAEPGMVLSIDLDSPGKLVVSAREYDHTVAGIVSGANGVRPGMLMGQYGSIADGKHAVALTGRVYVKCTTYNGAIKPGDLLTTSKIRGHAMKATNRELSPGAIIGKAMGSLDEETGMVLCLVSLQ